VVTACFGIMMVNEIFSSLAIGLFKSSTLVTFLHDFAEIQQLEVCCASLVLVFACPPAPFWISIRNPRLPGKLGHFDGFWGSFEGSRKGPKRPKMAIFPLSKACLNFFGGGGSVFRIVDQGVFYLKNRGRPSYIWPKSGPFWGGPKWGQKGVKKGVKMGPFFDVFWGVFPIIWSSAPGFSDTVQISA